MFDRSFSVSIILPQVQMCQQACTLNEKCSRRNEKSKKHRSRPPTMMKNDKNRNFSKNSKLIENTNPSFCVQDDQNVFSMNPSVAYNYDMDSKNSGVSEP